MPLLLLVVVEVVLVVVLLLVFCAKTRLPKVNTKIRLTTTPSFFATADSPLTSALRLMTRTGKACSEFPSVVKDERACQLKLKLAGALGRSKEQCLCHSAAKRDARYLNVFGQMNRAEGQPLMWRFCRADKSATPEEPSQWRKRDNDEHAPHSPCERSEGMLSCSCLNAKSFAGYSPQSAFLWYTSADARPRGTRPGL